MPSLLFAALGASREARPSTARQAMKSRASRLLEKEPNALGFLMCIDTLSGDKDRQFSHDGGCKGGGGGLGSFFEKRGNGFSKKMTLSSD